MSIKITPYLRPSKVNPENRDQLAIYLRIHVNGKRTLQSVKYYATKKQWDSKMNCLKEEGDHVHPQAEMINGEIRKQKAEVDKRYDHNRHNGDGNTDIRAIVKGEKKPVMNGTAIKNDANFFVYVTTHIQELLRKHPDKYEDENDGRLSVYKTILSRLEGYTECRELMFSGINDKFLDEYQMHMASSYHQNTIHENMKVMQKFCRLAKKKKVINYDCFDGYTIPDRVAAATKDYLTIEELDLLEEYAENTPEEDIMVKCARKRKDGTHKMRVGKCGKKQAAIYFLFGCYTGLRISDWRKFNFRKHLVEGGIAGFVTTKTGSPVVIPTNNKRLIKVLDMMRKTPLTASDELIRDSIRDGFVQKLGLDKEITPHCARKTFAVTLCANRGVSAETCAELMSIDIATCVNSYYKVTPLKIATETAKAWKDL